MIQQEAINMKKVFFLLILFFTITVFNAFAIGEQYVKPFFSVWPVHNFILEETQVVHCNDGTDYDVRWYRDSLKWKKEDNTFSKMEILHNGIVLASFVNDDAWVRFTPNSSDTRIAETFAMSDSVTMLIVAGRAYSAGLPELCLIKLENGGVSVIYNQEQAIKSIQTTSDAIVLSLEGYVFDCRNYIDNKALPQMTDYNPTLKLSKKEIVVEDGNGSRQVIYRNWLDYSTGGLKYQLNPRNAEASVVGYTQGSVAYTIPSTISYQGITYNVVAIADSAFYGCQQLNRVTIPNTVRTIGSYAFTGTSLSMIFCSAQVPPVCGTYAFLRILLHNCRLSVPGESVDNYRNASPWNMFTFMDDLIR